MKKTPIIIFLVLILSCGFSFYAFGFVLSSPLDKNEISTNDLIKNKVNYGHIIVLFDSLKIKKCKKISPVTNSKKIEMWQVNRACDLRLAELKAEVAFLKGDTLFINPENFLCEVPIMGEAYLCN